MTFTKIPWLAPGAVKLTVDAGGLTLVYQGVETPGLVAVRAFPSSAADGVIALRDATRRTVALIDGLHALAFDTRSLLAAALAAQVFAPEILRVESLTYDEGGYAWRVITDAGPRAFRTRQSWTALPATRVPPPRTLSTPRPDVPADAGRSASSVAGSLEEALSILADDGVRYRISDLRRLDAKSLRLLVPVI